MSGQILTTAFDFTAEQEMISGEANHTEILEEAIQIVVSLMHRIEAESDKNEYWYLTWLKMRNVFQHLCHRKYLGDA